MNIKSERGFTGVDIAISLVVLFIFVSLIAVLTYNYSSSAKELELRSEATYLAIDEIEKVKNFGYDKYANLSGKDGPMEGENAEEIEGHPNFYRTTTVMDYTEMEGNENKIPNLVKKVTVTVSYMFHAKEQRVELSTVLSKEKIS